MKVVNAPVISISVNKACTGKYIWVTESVRNHLPNFLNHSKNNNVVPDLNELVLQEAAHQVERDRFGLCS